MQAGWAADSPYHAVLAANIFCGLCADEVALMMEQGVFGQPVFVRINAGSSAVQGRACGTSLNHAVLIMGYDVRREN